MTAPPTTMACCALAHARQLSKAAVGMMKLLAFLQVKVADLLISSLRCTCMLLHCNCCIQSTYLTQ